MAGVLAPGVALSLAGRALACPDCPTSRLVSEAVCAGGPWHTAAVTVVPFVVFALVAMGLHRLGRPNGTGTRR